MAGDAGVERARERDGRAAHRGRPHHHRGRRDGEGGDDAVDALRYLFATPRARFGLAIA